MSTVGMAHGPGGGPANGASSSPGPICARCLSLLPPALLSRIRRESPAQRHRAGTILLREGEPSRHAWLVTEGWVKIARSGENGRRRAIRLLGPGDCWCLAPASGTPPSPVSIECLSEAAVVTLGAERLAELAEIREYTRGVIGCLVERLRAAVGETGSASRLGSLQRVAAVLLDLASRHGVGTERGTLIQGISQEDLASCAGTVREVAARALSKLEKRGVLERSRGRILILDRARLEAVLRARIARTG